MIAFLTLKKYSHNAIFPGTNDSKLIVQVRTTIVGSINATGFTGIAVQEGNSEVVQLNLESSGIVLCLSFYIEGNGRWTRHALYPRIINRPVILLFQLSFV